MIDCFAIRAGLKVCMDGHGRRPGTYFQGWTPSCHLLGQHSLDAVHAASMQQTNSSTTCITELSFVKQNQRNDTPIMYSVYVPLSISGLSVLSLKPLSLSESISLWSLMYLLNLTFCLCLSVCLFLYGAVSLLSLKHPTLINYNFKLGYIWVW